MLSYQKPACASPLCMSLNTQHSGCFMCSCSIAQCTQT
jgi:hypothetical protein